jgi:hypothetical protein
MRPVIEVSAKSKAEGTTMRHSLTLLTILLLAPLAARDTKRNLPGVPGFGILRAGTFQALESFGAMASNDWN